VEFFFERLRAGFTGDKMLHAVKGVESDPARSAAVVSRE
jgi:hypothetical protein